MRKNTILKTLIALSIFALVITLSLVFTTTFAAELPEATETAITTTTTQATTPEATAQATSSVEKLVDWLKSVNMADFKGWIVGLMSYFGVNLGVFIFVAIKLLMFKSEQFKQEKFYKELIAKMDETHKKEMEELVDGFNKELADVNKNVLDCIKKQNSERRQIAKDNVDKVREALGEINVALEKEE